MLSPWRACGCELPSAHGEGMPEADSLRACLARLQPMAGSREGWQAAILSIYTARAHGPLALGLLVISGRPPISARASAHGVPTQRGGRGDSGDTARPDGLHPASPSGSPRGKGWGSGARVYAHTNTPGRVSVLRGHGVRSCLALAAQLWGRPVLSGSLSGTARGNNHGTARPARLIP